MVLGVVEEAQSRALATTELGDELVESNLFWAVTPLLSDSGLQLSDWQAGLTWVEDINELGLGSVKTRRKGRNDTYALLSVQKSVVDELSGSEDDIFSHSPL